MPRLKMTNEFWANRYSWPNDPKGYVFLARAVDELGQALNGSGWTGKEYLIEFPSQLPLEMPRRLCPLRSWMVSSPSI